MKTLNELQQTVAKATHITLIYANKQNSQVSVKQRVYDVSSKGFSLAENTGGQTNASHLQWPKPSEVTFSPSNPLQFRVFSGGLIQVYEIQLPE